MQDVYTFTYLIHLGQQQRDSVIWCKINLFPAGLKNKHTDYSQPAFGL